MWMTFGLACCAVEMIQAAMPRYDLERFGFAPRQSAPVRRHHHRRHAHQQDGPALRKVYDRCRSRATSSPWLLRQWRGYYHYSYSVVRGCDRIIRSTSMCRLPAIGGALVYGVLLLQKKIRRTGTIER